MPSYLIPRSVSFIFWIPILRRKQLYMQLKYLERLKHVQSKQLILSLKYWNFKHCV